jgi:large repetitive protein
VFGIISGQLPPGLALSTVSGGISGTPLQAGTFTFSVQVKDSTGHSDSSAYSLNIASVPAANPAPIISGASPNSGPASGGTAVTISGTNFQTGATVLFGGLAAAPVTFLSATQIQVMTPTHLAGAVDVTVRNLDGQSATLSSGFTYTAPPPVNPPTITGISPNSGPTSGETAVTISVAVQNPDGQSATLSEVWPTGQHRLE